MFKYLEWETKYDVGIKRFNEQHMCIIEAIKDIYGAMQNKEDKTALYNILKKLIKYASEHLEEEEACLLNNNYPELEEHKKQHRFFVEKVEQFQNDFKEDKFMIYFEMAVFLKNWMLNHISEEDMKYKKYLNDRGIS